MGKELTDKSRVIRNIVILAIILLIFIIYYTIMAMLGPGRKSEALSAEYYLVQEQQNDMDSVIREDSTYISLLKQKSFLQSRMTMAETDSIYLTVNLSDSIFNLEINGVSLHTARISKFNLSKIISEGNEFILASMMAQPFNILKNFSTIKKEPLMIRMAPRDTSEYQPDVIPDTADTEPVFFIMETNKGIRFIIYQEERINPGDGLRLFMFDLLHRIRNTLQGIKSIMLLRVPEYHPYIKIRINRGDAKIIFRAMPENGQIGVFI
jgi:hypothetical protein